jgi:hypothetical protein
VNDRLCITHLLGNFDDMAVMGQVNGLAASPDPFHQTTRCARAIFIEGFEDIVAEERKLYTLGHHLLVGGGAQGQLKLEPGTL